MDLSFPVMSDWDYAKLKISPCRYMGFVYQDNMVIAAHNYPKHFGNLKDLKSGDEVIFLDVSGNEFIYVRSNAVEEMEEGDWDLTLFTCIAGGRARIAVRCVQKEGKKKNEIQKIIVYKDYILC